MLHQLKVWLAIVYTSAMVVNIAIAAPCEAASIKETGNPDIRARELFNLCP
ncbi:hypothetical protein D9619_013371 [Psilocybe cf. subviscida]|uniref:Uncharacterized protein n=1 Tax=Psilocybe cf. subviscida TaxID=2480587 RepID=A0A8H5BRZ2_9AGAR|nr:hypothetical protein D9619_013371 [Psilocybe cf. subviscida]